MNERKLVHNFKSYLGLEDSSLKDNGEKDAPLEEFKPKLLAGELVIGAAHNVILFAPMSEQQKGRYGSLFVTNYKLSFVTAEENLSGGCRQQNYVLGPYDVPLSMVESVVELSRLDGAGLTSRVRRRTLRPDQQLPARVQGLQVHCKNMRVLMFGFKQSGSGPARTLVAALLHHAFPRRHHLLFAYEHREPYHPPADSLHDINMYQRGTDWKKEMDRTNCNGQTGQSWRISRANGTADAFFIGAGDSLVVPASVTDFKLAEAARHFRKGRVPVWVWSAPGGAALARSAELCVPGSSASTGTAALGTGSVLESTLLEACRRSHPVRTPPHLISVRAPPLQRAHARLKKLCAPTTLNDFWEQDGSFYSALDNTRWMLYVSECLSQAAQAAESLNNNVTVVLQEGDGVDYCAVVSTLTQLLLDSHFRTIKGFQSLIQKEWIALGHPFSDRLGHVTPDPGEVPEGDHSMSPVLLLLLDCCWQLLQQFPDSFQYTGVYLTTLWDAAHNQLYETFLFNSPRDREIAINKCVSLRPVWDWSEQFSEEEIQYFYNPLYTPCAPTHAPKSVIPASAIRLPGLASPAKAREQQWLSAPPTRLVPQWELQALQLWRQCHLRWLPPLHLPASGDSQLLLHNMRITREIKSLQEKVDKASMENNRRSNGFKEEDSTLVLTCPHETSVGAFFPFIGNNSEPLQPLPDPKLLEPDQEFDTQSILNAPD